MAIDLRSLRYFIAVAEEGNFTRAAERLNMQQPPLSRQLQSLERALDLRLFRRKARGVELTSAGQVLLAEARATLSQLDRAVNATRRAARGEEGRLSVGIAPTAPFHPLVPQAIRSFREALPQVSLTLWEGLSNEVAERFAKQEMDVAFVRAAKLGGDALQVARLFDEPMIVALPTGHALAQQPREKPVALARLSDDTFIIVGPPGTGIHDETLAACKEAGFSPRIGQEARITSTLGLVAAGLGVAIVPASIQRMSMDGVTFRRLSDVRPTAFLGLAWRRTDTSPLVRRFLSLVRRAVDGRR